MRVSEMRWVVTMFFFTMLFTSFEACGRDRPLGSEEVRDATKEQVVKVESTPEPIKERIADFFEDIVESTQPERKAPEPIPESGQKDGGILEGHGGSELSSAFESHRVIPDSSDRKSLDNAAIVSFKMPKSMKPGETVQIQITVKNTGRSTWTRTAGYKLGTVGDSDPFHAKTRVTLKNKVSVVPNQTYTFETTLKAPATPGNYVTDWQMVKEGVYWFGKILKHTIRVEGNAPKQISTTSLSRKIMAGYQGWFSCPGDGSPLNRWVHWFRTQSPVASDATFDMWPAVSELSSVEKCSTKMTFPSGKVAPLFSSYRKDTVVRHFKWMHDHGIDGVFLQRFSSTLKNAKMFAFRNQVAQNVRAGAERHGRMFAMMYDISGHNSASLVNDLKKDWMYLVDTLKILQSKRYLHHKGRPLLAIWGFGFHDRPVTPAQAKELIDWWKNKAPAKYRVTLMGGVPTYWRTLSRDSKTDKAWAGIYRSFDVVSPWAVGRYGDDKGADSFRKTQIEPDLKETQKAKIDYLPVVFPGFSWYNLKKAKINSIPRRGGKFLWRQFYNAIQAGNSMVYVAMFDEVDEGTAIFKTAENKSQQPSQGSFLTLDADGLKIPSDWYLRLTGEASKMLRKDIPLTSTIPIKP